MGMRGKIQDTLLGRPTKEKKEEPLFAKKGEPLVVGKVEKLSDEPKVENLKDFAVMKPVDLSPVNEKIEALEKENKRLLGMINDLQYELSAVLLQQSKLVKELEEEKKAPEGTWRPVYRIHQPEVKDFGIALTTQERREGHVVERGYTLELCDGAEGEPVLRVKRMN